MQTYKYERYNVEKKPIIRLVTMMARETDDTPPYCLEILKNRKHYNKMRMAQSIFVDKCSERTEIYEWCL